MVIVYEDSKFNYFDSEGQQIDIGDFINVEGVGDNLRVVDAHNGILAVDISNVDVGFPSKTYPLSPGDVVTLVSKKS